eukprot:15444365-Alexandrium_andersonii.AAC.1
MIRAGRCEGPTLRKQPPRKQHNREKPRMPWISRNGYTTCAHAMLGDKNNTSRKTRLKRCWQDHMDRCMMARRGSVQSP